MLTGINLLQLKTYVVQPVLAAFPPRWNTPAAEVLLLGTGGHESGNGHEIHQLGGGPALGWLQMEPATHDDCWKNFLDFRQDIAAAVKRFMVPSAGAGQLVWNLAYAAAMARVKYIRDPNPLPPHNDYVGLAQYYKRVFNSALGAAVVDEALVDCFRQAAAA